MSQIQHKVQVDMCVQRRFSPVCGFTQSDQNISFLPEETLEPCLPIECPLKTDQTRQMHRLILVFDGCTCQLVPYVGFQFINANLDTCSYNVDTCGDNMGLRGF